MITGVCIYSVIWICLLLEGFPANYCCCTFYIRVVFPVYFCWVIFYAAYSTFIHCIYLYFIPLLLVMQFSLFQCVVIVFLF